MASARRCLTSASSLLSRRFHPSVSHLLPPERKREGHSVTRLPDSRYSSVHHFHDGGMVPSGVRIRERSGLGLTLPFAFEHVSRGYTTSSSGESSEVGYAKDVADVLTEKGTPDVTDVFSEKSVQIAQAAAPPVGEVAAAAADSAPPVAALQYFIDAVHNYAGLNWWASIVVATIIIRCCTVPLMIHQLKANSKLAVLRPELEELKERMQNATDHHIMQENQRRIKELFKKHGVSPFTPLKGLFIQGPVFISFYLAISNMVQKVPTFKEGGVFWFTDLTTSDPFYALPILTGMSFLLTVEFNMQEGMEGNPMAKTMKTFSRLLAFLTIPFTASFPKVLSLFAILFLFNAIMSLISMAIFCYWITSNLYSLTYGIVLKRPPVRKFLNLPEAPPPQPSHTSSSGPTLPIFGASRQSAQATTVSARQQSQYPDRKISSSSVISQRIRNLEKTVKGRGKSKRR